MISILFKRAAYLNATSWTEYREMMTAVCVKNERSGSYCPQSGKCGFFDLYGDRLANRPSARSRQALRNFTQLSSNHRARYKPPHHSEVCNWNFDVNVPLFASNSSKFSVALWAEKNWEPNFSLRSNLPVTVCLTSNLHDVTTSQLLAAVVCNKCVINMF